MRMSSCVQSFLRILAAIVVRKIAAVRASAAVAVINLMTPHHSKLKSARLAMSVIPGVALLLKTMKICSSSCKDYAPILRHHRVHLACWPWPMVSADRKVNPWLDMKPVVWLLRQLPMSCYHSWPPLYLQVHIRLQVITLQYRELTILGLYISLLLRQIRYLNNGWERAYDAQIRLFTIAMQTMKRIWLAP